jgi:single-stranded-DNA-specific exonuclease
MSRLPDGADGTLDATFALERNEYNGAVEPRLLLRRASLPSPAPITVIGEPQDFLAGVFAELDAALEPASGVMAPEVGGATLRDRRGTGVAGTIAALVASGEPVLVACADTARRRRHLEGRLGGFALVSWQALERDPGLAAGFAHLVALDPPACARHEELLHSGPPGRLTHLVYGPDELRLTVNVIEHDFNLRDPLAAVYRALRDAPGEGLERALRGPGSPPRSAAQAGRLLRVLVELGLAELDREARTVRVPPARRTELERSAAYRAYAARLEEGRRWLTSESARAA